MVQTKVCRPQRVDKNIQVEFTFDLGYKLLTSRKFGRGMV